MELVKHETCQEYVNRRLSEGWEIVWQQGYHLILSSPDGNILRPVDLRNDVETLRPNAAGDFETIIGAAGDGAGTHWTVVDEAIPDEGTTYLFAGGDTTQKDTYNLQDTAIPGGATINSVKVYLRVRTGTGDYYLYAYPILRLGGNETEGTQIYRTGVAAWETYSEALSRPGGGSWSSSDLNSLQAGLRMYGSWAHCTQVYVEVDYTSVTEKSSSDTGSGVDAYVSLETGEIKTSSDAGSGAEGTPMQSATLFGGETGFGIEAYVARLLAAFDTGTGAEVSGLLKDLFASELGQGSDSFVAKIETPTKGGGMKLWI